jgi:hypothetical protein
VDAAAAKKCPFYDKKKRSRNLAITTDRRKTTTAAIPAFPLYFIGVNPFCFQQRLTE